MKRGSGTERFIISVRPTFLKALDTTCERIGKTRSEFVRDAIRFYLENGQHLNGKTIEEIFNEPTESEPEQDQPFKRAN